MSNNLTEHLLSKEEKQEDKKKISSLDINIKQWDNDIEDLLKCWGEKSAGLSVLHNKDRQYWRNKSNNLSIACIIITTISSSLSLSSTNSQYYTLIMYLVGGIGMLSSLLQSFKQFYNADEKASEHRFTAKQYANFYRSIKLQLTLKRNDRVKIKDFVNWAFKEYEKLQQEAPIINEKTILQFNKIYIEDNFAKPDICENDILIEINRK
tara:strand:- start:391 stop:1017 length:627 start_codon:yes stop_codon:yes gene_type:complete